MHTWWFIFWEDVADLLQRPWFQVSKRKEEKKKKQELRSLTFYNPVIKRLYLFVFSQLIQRTSSPSATASFTDREKKILSVIQTAGRSAISYSIWPDFEAVSAGKLFPSPGLRMIKCNDHGVTEWSSSWWPHLGSCPRAPGRPACLSASRRRHPGGEVLDRTGGVSSVRPHSPTVYLPIRQVTTGIRMTM